MHERHIVIVAGGHGSRMGSDLPKQFLEIGSYPILMRTVEAFWNFDKLLKITLVLPEEYTEFWKKLCVKFNFDIEHRIVCGGKERFFSVKNALAEIPDESTVGIHDAVRPFVSRKTLEDAFCAAEKYGAAVPVMPATESIRKVLPDGDSESLDRKEIFTVQTPQCFGARILKTAYDTAYSPLFTDDASVVETVLHKKPHLTEGNRENIKITTPYDMKLAEWILSKEKE